MTLRLGLRDAPRPNAMPLLDGRPLREGPLSVTGLLAKLFMLKLPGKKENLRLFRRLSACASEFLRRNWKLLRRLSVDGLRPPSSAFTMVFFMLTGGCLRSFFSVGVPSSCACCDCLRELVRPSTRSVRLPSVELRLWPR